MTNRLFISADIPDEIKDRVIELRNSIYGIDKSIKWEGREKLHFTIKFLGDVEENKVPNIISSMKNILGNQKSINCSFEKFGIFKKGDSPSILWLGINYNNDLNNLAERINDDFQNLGFAREKRKFKAHLTLLRIKGEENLEKIYSFLNLELHELDFVINEISLVKSELRREGSVYSRIKSFKLNK